MQQEQNRSTERAANDLPKDYNFWYNFEDKFGLGQIRSPCVIKQLSDMLACNANKDFSHAIFSDVRSLFVCSQEPTMASPLSALLSRETLII